MNRDQKWPAGAFVFFVGELQSKTPDVQSFFLSPHEAVNLATHANAPQWFQRAIACGCHVHAATEADPPTRQAARQLRRRIQAERANALVAIANTLKLPLVAHALSHLHSEIDRSAQLHVISDAFNEPSLARERLLWFAANHLSMS